MSPRNVAAAADLPKGATPEMRVWSPEQLRVFLDHVRDDRLYAAWLLLATTGMRRGEVAGLGWVDLDLDTGRVAPRRPRVVVNHQVLVSEPKTAKGRRSIALDPATVAALREHRRWQLEDRLAVGPRWEDSGLVFTWPDGRPLHPERFSKWFEQAAGTVAQLILGKPRRQKPSDDKALTRGRRAARGRREVKGEQPGQRWGDRRDLNPRPSGPQSDRLAGVAPAA
jgi:integrase